MNIDLALAEAVLVVHLFFILWVIGGVLLVRLHPELQWVHIASLVYSIFIELVPWLPCPLTVLEQGLVNRAGFAAYHGSFLLHYLDELVYPSVPPDLLVAMAVVFCAGTIVYYVFAWRRRKLTGRHSTR